MPTNNHPNRNATQSQKLREQYEAMESVADILNGLNQHELAHAVRCAIFDLKQLKKELKNARVL